MSNNNIDICDVKYKLPTNFTNLKRYLDNCTDGSFTDTSLYDLYGNTNIEFGRYKGNYIINQNNLNLKKANLVEKKTTFKNV